MYFWSQDFEREKATGKTFCANGV